LHADDYQEALKLGEVLVAYARVMMIGPGGVGKSSLLRGLLNQKLPQEADSTMLADTKTLKPHFGAKNHTSILCSVPRSCDPVFTVTQRRDGPR